MWEEIREYFKKYPAQQKVAFFLLERGLRVSEEGRVACGTVEIPHTKIAKDVGVDRRVIDATAKMILGNEKLRKIYENLGTVPFLRDIAPELGLGVIVISAEDASKPGIMGRVTEKIAEEGISIRQAIADDPYLTEEPKLTIITEKEITGELLKELKGIEGIKKITIY